MIKLIRPDKPIELTPEVENQLVKEILKRTENPVWRKKVYCGYFEENVA